MVYTGIVGCARTMVKSEGPSALFKGFTATILSGVPFVAIQLTLFGVRGSAFAGRHEPPLTAVRVVMASPSCLYRVAWWYVGRS